VDDLTLNWPKMVVEGRELDFDPVAQWPLWVPQDPYTWQKKLLRACCTSGARVACVTPNESGKTSKVIPVLGLSWMSAFPGSQVVSTAGVERQVSAALWPVLKGALGQYQGWNITDDLKITAPRVDERVPGSEWIAFATRDPKRAEGFHSRWFTDSNGKEIYAPLLIIIDEAKAFDDPEMMFAFMQRCSPDVLLMISTPGEDTGEFYDAFHKNADKWTRFEVGWDDCPHLKQGFKLRERLDKIKELGVDHPFILSWVHGKFYRAGAMYVFDRMSDIDWAMGGLVPELRGERRAALDFSAGGDEQVFAARDGNTMIALESFHEKDTARLGKMFVERCRKLGIKPDETVGDEGGLGHAVMDNMESLGFKGIRRYSNNTSARNESYYFNRAAEDHYELKYLMMNRSIKLIRDDKLREQIAKRRFIMPRDDSNRIRLEPKDKGRNRGEGSPDRLDTVVMLFSDCPPYYAEEKRKEIAKKSGRCPTSEECVADLSGGGGGMQIGGYFDED
jgi:hypothetical protein